MHRCTFCRTQVYSDGVITMLGEHDVAIHLHCPGDSVRTTDATFTVESGPESACEENSVNLVSLELLEHSLHMAQDHLYDHLRLVC